MEDQIGKIHIDVDEEKRNVVFGGQLATAFVKKMVAGERIHGRRFSFDGELIREIHKRVEWGSPQAGQLRQREGIGLGWNPLSSFVDLPTKLYLFGHWLKDQMETLAANPEDLVYALRIAAAAHFGLTMKEFHPFPNGNGRTARALMNAILMSQSYELVAHRLAIPPISIVRTETDRDQYIKALQAVEQTQTLNPFMIYVAKKWTESLDERLERIKTRIQYPRTKADHALLMKLESRRNKLNDFIKQGIIDEHGHPQQFPVLMHEYFTPKRLR